MELCLIDGIVLLQFDWLVVPVIVDIGSELQCDAGL